jgi:type I restriction enzyme, R subunit
MKPEKKARQQIDQLLDADGWVVQDYPQLNLSVSLGVAVRDLSLKTGPADYVLFVDGKPAGTDEDTILEGYIQAQLNLYLETNKSND